MRNSAIKRVGSALMALIMVLLMVPVGAFPVNADVTTPITDTANMGFLGRGFNLLGNSPLENATISDKGILKSLVNVDATVTDARDTEYLFTYIKDFSSYLKNESSSATYSAEASAKIKIVSLEAKAKYGLQSASSYANSSETQYAVLSILRTYEKKYMDLSGTKYIQRLWGQNEDGSYITLSDDFVEELYSVGTADEDIAAFFARYGTHIITRYMSGGEAILAYSGEDLSSAASVSSSTELNASAKIDVASIVSISGEMEQKGASEESSSTASSDITFTGSVRGGDKTMEPSQVFDMMNGGNTAITAWTDSINAGNSQILVDDRPSDEEDTLKLLPIWELLYKPEDAQLKVALKEYFNRNVNAQYAEFYESYIYDPIDDPDYSGYTFITTKEQLSQVHNDLNGKYVLLCDLDLGGEEWTPIGTYDAPFTGVFDGNGCTVAGLSVTRCTDGAAGLFGYNDGTIRDLCVEGSVNADGTGNENNVLYAGGIAGYNSGRIENCKNMVTLNGKITVTEESNETPAVQERLEYDLAAIEAKLTAANTYDLTVYEGGTIDLNNVAVVKLTGTAVNPVNLSVTSYSATPLYIILEDAVFSGDSANGTVSSTYARPIWIISKGTQNVITNSNHAITVNTPSTQLSIVGDAKLTLTGGSGADASGQQTDGTGNAGGSGSPAVQAASICVDAENVTLCGGSGGRGADGVDAPDGTDGTSKAYKNGQGTAGATPSAGGAGGVGGEGGYAVENIGTIEVLHGTLQLVGGTGGDGGNGGAGGAGGDGGDSGYYLDTVFIASTYHVPYSGANAGSGSAGGNGGDGQFGQAPVEAAEGIAVTGNGICTLVSGLNGAGGDGGDGGNGGNGGDDGAILAYNSSGKDWYWVGDQHTYGGYGGAGGAGGKGGNGRTVGQGGTGGLGGSAGYQTARKSDKTTTPALTAGRNGSDGADGAQGEALGQFGHTDAVNLYTQSRKYTLYNSALSYADAVQACADSEKPVSVGSETEQSVLETMVSIAGGGAYWIGLSWDVSNNRCDWADGNWMITPSELDCAYSDGKYVYGNSYDMFDELTYDNWSAEEPSNADSVESAVAMYGPAAGEYLFGTWDACDPAIITAGYITETDISPEPAVETDKNGVFIGGITGCNAWEGTLISCINHAAVTVDKAFSAQGQITAAAGGIAGVNTAAVTACYNSGAIVAVAKSEGLNGKALAFAFEITKNLTDATEADCVCTGNMCTVTAKSATDTVKGQTDNDSITTDLTAIQPVIDGWKNSVLSIRRLDKTSYAAGSAFDHSTISVTLNGQTVEDYAVWYYFLSSGCRMVKISYFTSTESYQRSFPIMVTEPVVQSISVSEDSVHRTEFEEDDTFSADGLILTLHYDNDSTESVIADTQNVSVPDMSTVGEKTMTVTHNGMSTRYTVKVSPKTGAVWIYENGSGISKCDSLSQALENYDARYQYLKLFADVQADDVLTQDLYIDLNGFDLTGVLGVNGYQVYGMDSTTDSYSCAQIGYFDCIDDMGDPVIPRLHLKSTHTGSIKRYMRAESEEGYSFHRFYLGITAASIKPTTDSVGYKAVFAGDEMVQDQIETFGYSLRLGSNAAVMVERDGALFQSGKTVTLRVDGYDVENHGETKLNARVFLTVDGEMIYSASYGSSLREMVERVNENAVAFTQTQLAALREMIARYKVMQSWSVENI